MSILYTDAKQRCSALLSVHLCVVEGGSRVGCSCREALRCGLWQLMVLAQETVGWGSCSRGDWVSSRARLLAHLDANDFGSVNCQMLKH